MRFPITSKSDPARFRATRHRMGIEPRSAGEFRSAAWPESAHARIPERTNDGRTVAMASGVRFGSKPHPATASALALIRRRVSFKAVSEKTGISEPTYFRLKRRLFTAEHKGVLSAM